MICTRCGTIGWPQRHTPRSFGLELLLFLLFVIPCLVYGVWRLAARRWVCAACVADALVPIDSPTGRLGRRSARPAVPSSRQVLRILWNCDPTILTLGARQIAALYSANSFLKTLGLRMQQSASITLG
jgi:hypothetical protein